MTSSANTNELFSALSVFQGEYKQVKFDAEVKVQTKSGSSYSFEYATLSGIIETLRPTLTKNGLSVIQTFDDKTLETILCHKSGQWILSRIPLNLQGNNQEQGAEITYKRRYAYACVCGITADEDDDSNTTDSHSFEKKTKGVEPTQKKESISPYDKAINAKVVAIDSCMFVGDVEALKMTIAKAHNDKKIQDKDFEFLMRECDKKQKSLENK